MSSAKTFSHMNNNDTIDVCADCSQTNPIWASINHGTLICDQCAIIHRSLGRFISQIKPLKSNNWKMSQLQMVFDLYRSGSNSIWEHTLLDPHVLSSGHSIANTHKGHQHLPAHYPRKKPQPNDPLHPNKSDFIRAKYQMFAYVNKSHGMKDDAESESDISEQLHSSVRTPNLKTSLRLLVAGANPNYIHSEKFNSPLHMAARSGQMSQIELLLIYGANLALVDSKNKSAIDYAREAGHNDIVYRLIEHQFELSDTLTRFICQGRQPNHRNGEHFLIVDIKADFLNYMDSSSNEYDKKRSSTEAFRNELHQSIRSLSHKSFEELSRDLYDELDRRDINSFVTSYYANENGKLSILHQQLITPFLPVYQYFSTTRNQGRQKLALLNTKEITLLIIDVLNEIRRRVYSSSGSLKKDDSLNRRIFNEFEDEDSEPLYDSVPSEEDYDECNELVSPPTKIAQQPIYNNIQTKVTTTASKNENRVTSTIKKEESFVSNAEYSALKEQMLKSTNLMEIFLNENKVMRLEIARLQSMVEKLVEENVQLRHFIIPGSHNNSIKSSIPHEPPKSSSMLIENSEHFNHNNFSLHNSNRVRPQSMSNHLNSSSSNHSMVNNHPPSFAAGELFSIKTAATGTNLNAVSVSPSKSSNSSILNYFSSSQQSHSQSQRNASPSHAPYTIVFNPNTESFINSPNSSSSSLSSQIPHPNPTSASSSSSFQQIGSDLNQQMKQLCQITSKTSAVNNSNHLALKKSASKSSLPTKDEVIKKIEFITNGIKELLIKAKEGKHDEFQQCSERICNSVSDMINLFPESIESSKIDNLLQLNQALIVLQTNVLQLHDECHSYESLPRFQHITNQDNRYIYNTVIDKAAEVASSVKSIINLYTIQSNHSNSNNTSSSNANTNHNNSIAERTP